jgi:hypothetical protein
MQRTLIVGALLPLSLALAACGQSAAAPLAQAEQAGDDQPTAAPVQPPEDHTLRDGLIGGALGYVAGRATAPRATAAPVYRVTHITHVAAPAYRPAPVWRPSYNASRSPSVVTRTTVTRTYRR